MQRRDFLRFGLSGAALAGLGYMGLHLLNEQGPKTDFRILMGDNDFPTLLNPYTGSSQRFDHPFDIHSFIADPSRPGIFVAIPKFGKRFMVFAFDRKIQRPQFIDIPEKMRVYGHGQWTPDGSILYAGTSDYETGMGYLSAFDPKTWDEVARFPLLPGFTHEMRWMPDNVTLAIACSGIRGAFKKGKLIDSTRLGDGAIIFFNTKTSQILHNVPFVRPAEMLGHMRVAGDGVVHFVSSLFPPFKGDPKLKHPGCYEASMDQAELTQWVIPEKWSSYLTGELLSIELNEPHQLLSATLPSSKHVFIFDMKKKEAVGVIDSDSSGLAFDKSAGKIFFMGDPRKDGQLFNEPASFAFGGRPSSHFLAITAAEAGVKNI